MHDGMQYDPIQGQCRDPFKVGNPAIFKSYFLRHLQWELAADHGFLNKGTISKCDRAGFLIFCLVSVSCDFELARPSVRVYVRPSTKSFFDFYEIWHVGRGRWVMQYDPIQGQGQGHKPFKVGNPAIFNSCLLCRLQWELAIDH